MLQRDDEIQQPSILCSSNNVWAVSSKAPCHVTRATCQELRRREADKMAGCGARLLLAGCSIVVWQLTNHRPRYHRPRHAVLASPDEPPLFARVIYRVLQFIYQHFYFYPLRICLNTGILWTYIFLHLGVAVVHKLQRRQTSLGMHKKL